MIIKPGFPPTDTYKVMVQCCTYNHSLYIEDSLKGFANQQTKFKYVCCVFDDSSTDGEQDVLRSWIENHCNSSEVDIYDHPLAEILMAPDKDNPNCLYAIHLQKVNTFGQPEKREMIAHWEKQCEYEALCEGDDYWIDSNKLQRQVDFLDNNIEYSMCFHRALERLEDNNKLERIFYKVKDKDYSGPYIYKKWIVATASVMFRSSVLKAPIYQKLLSSKYFIYGDTPLFCACSYVGKLKGSTDLMSVYRRHSGGITKVQRSYLDFSFAKHQEEFYNIFGKRYYSPMLISTYYTRALYKCLTENRLDLCKDIIRQYPYKFYIIPSILSFPIYYLYRKCIIF